MRHMETAGSKLLVIGAGPVGLSLAVGLAKRGHGVRLLDAGPDLRTAKTPAPARSTALMPLSLETLGELGVWDRVKHLSAPLDKLRLIDDQADRWTNPVIEVFSADEVTDTPFGYNIINTDLSRALLEAAEACPNLRLHFDSAVQSWKPGEVTLADGVTFQADLIFDCAGRHSPVPEQAHIRIKDHRPNQVALVCQIDHSIDHDNISTEFQRREGPLTTVPLPRSNAGRPDQPSSGCTVPRLPKNCALWTKTGFAELCKARCAAFWGKSQKLGPEVALCGYADCGLLSRTPARAGWRNRTRAAAARRTGVEFVLC